MAESRVLLLIRHARAAEFDGGSDAERALTETGSADARAAGDWLRSQDLAPTQVLCSPAVRTRQTWAGISETLGAGGLVDHEPSIYNAGVQTLLDLVTTVEDSVRVLALVGHAPGVPHLAATLSDNQPDPAAAQALSSGYPTATITVLGVQTGWADLAAGAAHLRQVHTARAARD
ncbi:SixA phosphatase family protein [Dermacoccaceae bacterium W4C1]